MSASHPKAPGFAGGYLLLFGRLLEARAKGRTSEAIRALARLQPKTARILRGGETMEIAIDDVSVGDLVLGPVEIQRELMRAAARRIMAVKL